ncbi:MAG: B12-binding domain-containing radical SAM protein [Treponema sp.]|nr:B12-binding domain-containing radical SAM protein [Treponema sp.]
MKILLVSLNASYSHTSLSVRALYNYLLKEGKAFPCAQAKPEESDSSLATPSNGPQMPARNARSFIEYKEFTINQPIGEILRGIYQSGADLVLFSTYIWNAELISKIIPDIKKILPHSFIGAGGPEFSYAAKLYLEKLEDLDFVIFGEGERVLAKLAESLEIAKEVWDFTAGTEVVKEKLYQELKNVEGLFIRNKNQIEFTGNQKLICNLSELPFAYPELEERPLPAEVNNKIYYYESSRGCPYSCSYCMSSLDKQVRFMPLERVFHDLQIFLDANIPLVKFCDRTFNLQSQRYLEIWKYILSHHNGITMFHFEIEAENLSSQALEFLQNVPAGIMQFEIGVQSSNKKTLRAISRSDDVEKLAEKVRAIPKTIHQHLDLIAGLPFEDLESFGRSFDFVMDLKPDALQLGFLKILHGTVMEAYAKKNGWQWMQNPVYETFSTPYMSYQDFLFLKDLEVLLDAYWNSGKFPHLMNYLGQCKSFWNFFYEFTKWAQKKGTFQVARRETYWFSLFSLYLEENKEAFNYSLAQDLLRYDFVLRGKQGGWPDWYDHRYSKERHRKLLEEKGGITNARLDFAHSEYEVFDFNVDSPNPLAEPGRYEKLIRYNFLT